MYHRPYNKKEFQITMKCSTDLKDMQWFSFDGNVIIGDVIHKFGMKCVENYTEKDNKNTLNMQHKTNNNILSKLIDCHHE